MSAFRSALEEWVSEDVEHLHLDQLADDLVELEHVSGLLEVERLRRVSTFEDRAGPHHLGYPSLTAFLKYRCRMASGRAHRLVARSRVFKTATTTFRAWTGGRLSTDQASVLLDQGTAVPDQFTEGEERLVDIVSDLSVSDTRRVVDYWRQSVDGPGTIRDQLEQMELRGISGSKSLGGMIRVDGWMTTTAGEAFLAAIDALMPPQSQDDTRTPRQRRHDALEDLARHYLGHGDTPTVGGEKPHINLVCDLPALQGIAGGLHQTENGHILTVHELRTLACDCSLSRIVFGPEGEIIDVGRRTRVVPTATRRAVIARDQQCTWRHCDRNPRWCDVHHIISWANGGETEPGNLSLLCRHHHTLTHLEEANRYP
ncbi:MAG: DUF222 domain-containing protein, partial [Acidimicrobiia bacterium]